MHPRNSVGPGEAVLVIAFAFACDGADQDPAGAPLAPPPIVEDDDPSVDPFEAEGLEGFRPTPVFAWPVESVHLTSSLGMRVDPITGEFTRLHRGIDLRGRTGNLVTSVAEGVVRIAGDDPLLGQHVVVTHAEGYESVYGHLSDVLVHEGLSVNRGSALGLVGNTGRSEAPHLHLSITLDGIHVDPLALIGEPVERVEGLISGMLSPDPQSAPTGSDDPSEATPPGPDEAAEDSATAENETLSVARLEHLDQRQGVLDRRPYHPHPRSIRRVRNDAELP